MATSAEGSRAPGAFAEPREPGVSPQAEKLVAENLDWLRGWVRGRVNDPDLVHDICQESFLKALRSLETLKDVSSFPGWLFRIAQNTLRDHLRGQARRRRWLHFSDKLDEREAPGGGADRTAEAEEAEKLLEAVRALPARYREPLLLKHAKDLSYAEIGEILGITENAVQVRIFRARRMLRKTTETWVKT